MNTNLTELVYIIDMSGSMGPLQKDTIGGYNAMIQEQKKLNREKPELKANVTTVLFDDRYIVLHDRKDIDQVEDMTDKEYKPCGMTAMLDAIGKAVVSVGQKLAETPEEERPGLVSVTIITDGWENASKEYTWERVRNMIKEQKEKYSWAFSFIGANINVEEATLNLGIDSNMSATYTASSIGTASVYSSITGGTRAMRETLSATCSVDSAVTAYSVSLNDIK